MEEVWQTIYTLTGSIINSGEGKAKQVFGRDLIDLPPDELILYGTKLIFGDGTIELTHATPAALPTFEWLAEITIKEPGNVEHYLLRPDKTIVETYGKNVYDVGSARAQALADRVASLKNPE